MAAFDMTSLIIILVIAIILFVLVAISLAKDIKQKRESARRDGRQSGAGRDAAIDKVESAAMTGLMAHGIKRYVDKRSEENKEYEKYAYRWQEKVRDENPSFKEHLDDDF